MANNSFLFSGSVFLMYPAILSVPLTIFLMLSSSKIFSSAFFVILSIRVNASSSLSSSWLSFSLLWGDFYHPLLYHVKHKLYIVIYVWSIIAVVFKELPHWIERYWQQYIKIELPQTLFNPFTLFHGTDGICYILGLHDFVCNLIQVL